MKKLILTLYLFYNLNASSIIAEDKLLHFVGGLTIYSTCLIINDIFEINMDNQKCIIPVITAALAKEYHDSLGYGNNDVYDFVATITAPILLYTIEYKF
jgi:hypothetical protein